MLLLLALFSLASIIYAAPAQVLYLSPVQQIVGYQPAAVLQPFYVARAAAFQECSGSDFACLFNQNLNQSITSIQTQGQQSFDQLQAGAGQGFESLTQGFVMGFDQVASGAQSWAPGTEKTPANTIELKPTELTEMRAELKTAKEASRRIYTFAGYPQFFGNYEILSHPLNPLFSLQPLQAIKASRSLPDPIKNDKFLAQVVPGVPISPIVPVPIVPVQPIAEPLKALISEGSEQSVESEQVAVVQPEAAPAVVPIVPVLPVLQSRSQEVVPSENAIKEEPVVKEVASEAEKSIAQASPVADAIAGKGGLAEAAPIATAIVGKDGLALTKPEANAVAGDFQEPEPDTKKDLKEPEELKPEKLPLL